MLNCSGVTKVGVTRSGKLMVSPYIFFLKKVMTFLVIVPLSAFAFQLIVCPLLFVNSAAKILTFITVSSPLDGITLGGPPPPVLSLLQNIVFHFWPKLTHPAARSLR